MAQTGLPKYFRKAYQDFSGGLNTFNNPLVVKQNQFVQLDNALVNKTGILERCNGYTVDGSPFPNAANSWIRMMVNFKRGTTVDNLVVAAQDDGNTNANFKVDVMQTVGDSTYSYIGYTTGTATFTNGSANVSGSGTAWSTQVKAGDKIKPNATTTWYEVQSVTSDTALVLTATFGQATQSNAAYKSRVILNYAFVPVSTIFNNKLIITNGSDTPYSWDNTTTALITSANAPKGKFIERHKNRVFIANTSGNPSTVYWSYVNDETTWDAASLEPVFPQDNGNICAIKSFADSLIVLKDNGRIYQVIGDFDQDAIGAPRYIRTVDVPDNLGAIAGYSVVVHDDGRLWFISQTGVYAMDRNLQFEKMSWDINNDANAITISAGVTANKSYPYTTNAQWNTGTHDGTVASNGSLTSFFDNVSYYDALQYNENAAIAIDSGNVVHAAYGGTDYGIKYVRLATDGTKTQESAASTLMGNTTADPYRFVSVAVNPVDKTVGILYHDRGPTGGAANYMVERYSAGTATFTNGSTAVTGSGTLWTTRLQTGDRIKPDSSSTWYTISSVNSDTSITLSATFTDATTSAAAYGAWTAPQLVVDYGGGYGILSGSLAYRSDGGARCIIGGYNISPVTFAAYLSRSGLSTWTAGANAGLAGGAPDYYNVRVSLVFDASNNPCMVWTYNNGNIQYAKSTNDGVSWTTSDSITSLSIPTNSTVQPIVNGSGNVVSAFTDGSTVKKRNHNTTTTSTIDSSSGAVCRGYGERVGNSYTLIAYGATSQQDKYIFEGSTTLTNPTTNAFTNNTNTRVNRAIANNGRVFASISFGASSTEVVIRRISFTAVYTSPVQSDSSLTQWGVYQVTNEVDNSATVVHASAVSTTSSMPALTTITSGSVVSSDSTKVFNQFSVTITVGTYAAPVIGSIVLFYTGAGVGPALPTGCVFNNEIYFPCTNDGTNNNNKVIFYDRDEEIAYRNLSLSFLCRYKNALWGGSSTNGSVYKLNIGYLNNGATFTTTAVSKEDLLGSLELQKEVSKIYVVYQIQSSGTFTFSYRTDNYKSANGASWTDTVVDQTKYGIQEIHYTGQPFSSIQFKVTSSASGVNMGIIGWVVLYQYVNLR